MALQRRKEGIVAFSEEFRRGILLSHNVCFEHNNESKNRVHVYAAALVTAKEKEWGFKSGCRILRLCDSVIDIKKYILGLCPLFWNRTPKTLGYLFHPKGQA